MIKHLSLEQGSPSWLEYRRNRVGASEIAAVMGLCPYRTTLQVFDQKMMGIEIRENEDMLRGKEKEAFVRRMICEQYGRHYEPVVIENDKYEFGFASLDGWDEKAEVKILEIKNPRKNPSMIPQAHRLQMYYQMMIGAVDKALYVSCDLENNIVDWVVELDRSWLPKMEGDARDFYRRLVHFDSPEPSEWSKFG